MTLELFHPPVRSWFERSFREPTRAQLLGWPPIFEGKSTLLLAPTGSGKTLAAFLVALDRLLFAPPPQRLERCRVLYISPLKALAVDVERNLRAPLAGIAAEAELQGVPVHRPEVGIRTGDTPAKERAHMLRSPPDVLITTPESLFLLLTSQARSILATVETVIVDEIHSLVATKRGAHLALSLERLEALRRPGRPLQRIGLSATQRPLDEAARLLAGGTVGAAKKSAKAAAPGRWSSRPVEIVDAGHKKPFDLVVEVPVEDMSRLGEVVGEGEAVDPNELRSGSAAVGPIRRSIWPSIHPRLVQLIESHRSTMIFVNSRRLAERLSGALNELAGREIALAHHGSVSRDQRSAIEDRLKRGELPAIVATSSLELGIDMGAVDLVIQIEAPPSVASGLQRIGRAGHQVYGRSKGVIFPKHRGDLLGSAAAAVGMQQGLVEETYYPRNPLDVLAQQIVAICAQGTIGVEDLYKLVRGAAPFGDLPRSSFEGVLDMLSGRYPSDEFAELKARLTWDRIAGTLRAREGAGRVAIANAGTIPDRGLYGVFIPGEDGKQRRVGELDEEMVFESRVGEVFVLGASSWRIEEITQDKVLVTPAPGEPGKMPFWHGDRPGRPMEFGIAVGKLSRELTRGSRPKALERLQRDHGLDEKAARNLLAFLEEQKAATGEVPSDEAIVVERVIDEVGDFRVCVLTPFGARVHAPWATAVVARLRSRSDAEVEMLYSDDGMVFRLPESGEPPDPQLFFPEPDEIEDLVVQSLGGSSLFAARFRENAGRALLLPRRFPGKRSPLWAQRKKAGDLLAVAQRYGTFPLLLETYRECLRDVFDVPALVELLRKVRDRRIRVVTVDSRAPSPFASSLMFAYVANFIYDGDAPLAERRAQALSVDQAQLRELLGEAELRELLDPGALRDLEQHLQRLDGARPVRHADGVHDLLLQLGDLTEVEIAARAAPDAPVHGWIEALLRERRLVRARIASEDRLAAVEDVARLRDALGLQPPLGVPQTLLEPVADALGDLLSRYARTHGPFRTDRVAARFGLGVAPVRTALERLAAQERVFEGEFLPGGRGREWCDAQVLKTVKQRSLAKLRKQVEPVEPGALGRFLLEWQGIERPRQGLEALLSSIEALQGAPVPASALEREVLRARVTPLKPADLDVLTASGEVVWMGVEPIGNRDGRIALFLADHFPLLAPPARPVEGELAQKVRKHLASRGASFFADLVTSTAGFPADVLEALWALVWAGEVTNDTLAPLRSYLHGPAQTESPRERRKRHPFGVPGMAFRSRRAGPPGSEGRWSLLPRPTPAPSDTQRAAALAQALLSRYGIVTREAVHAEGVAGGFASVYPVLRAMEEAGRARRGYFVAGLGGAQFALPGAEDRLRALREPREDGETVVLAATDPANPYGAVLPWPGATDGDGARPGRPQRAAGAAVVLHDGELAAWLARGGNSLTTFLPADEPARSTRARAIAQALARLVDARRRRILLVSSIDGEDPAASPIAAELRIAGFLPGARGWLKRAPLGEVRDEPEPEEDGLGDVPDA